MERVYVERLEVRDLRNIRAAAVELEPGLNVFVGRNAQGKTSLLEAVALLARGRSFRTERIQQLIRRGAETTRARGIVVEPRHRPHGLARDHPVAEVGSDRFAHDRRTADDPVGLGVAGQSEEAADVVAGPELHVAKTALELRLLLKADWVILPVCGLTWWITYLVRLTNSWMMS